MSRPSRPRARIATFAVLSRRVPEARALARRLVWSLAESLCKQPPDHHDESQKGFDSPRSVQCLPAIALNRSVAPMPNLNQSVGRWRERLALSPRRAGNPLGAI